jgi:membrane protease YdiL (CAAX protease family)
MRDEDQPEGHAQNQGGNVARPPFHDRVITPLALFVCFYLAIFWIGVWSGLGYFQWVALGCACCATWATIALWHHGRWDLGLAPRFAPRELAIGAGFAVALIGSADVLILVLTPSHHLRGTGFPWAVTAAMFIPGALHEELIFRGYPYQIVRQFNRPLAMVASSLVFAGLHGWNSDVTTLALVNIFLGGAILALAYERYRRLWLPIGLHFAWNVLSGPILGYDVSGFTPGKSLLVAVVQGPAILTGGEFGIEGSIILTGMEIFAVGLLLRRTGMLNVEC